MVTPCCIVTIDPRKTHCVLCCLGDKHEPGEVVGREGWSPAPWVVVDCDGNHEILGTKGERLAVVFNRFDSDNAYLMAAAPLLVKALRGLLGIVEEDHCSMVDGTPEEDVREEVEAARNALNEAGRVTYER